MSAFSYNIEKFADEKAFLRACSMIEAGVSNFQKEKLLEDVDGTLIQIYKVAGGEIVVFNDYEIDAVFVNSDIDLGDVFRKEDAYVVMSDDTDGMQELPVLSPDEDDDAQVHGQTAVVITDAEKYHKEVVALYEERLKVRMRTIKILAAVLAAVIALSVFLLLLDLFNGVIGYFTR